MTVIGSANNATFHAKAGFILLFVSILYIISFWFISSGGSDNGPSIGREFLLDPVAEYVNSYHLSSSTSSSSEPPSLLTESEMPEVVKEVRRKLTRFEFVKERGETMRNKIMEMDDQVTGLKSKLATLEQDHAVLQNTLALYKVRHDRRKKLEKLETIGVDGNDGSDMGVVLFTFATEEDMPRLRTLIGSLHLTYETTPAPEFVVFTYNVTGKFTDELSYWENVHVVEAEHVTHFPLDSAEVYRKSHDRFVRLFIKYLVGRYADNEMVDTVVYLNSTVFFHHQEGEESSGRFLDKLRRSLVANRGVAVAKSDKDVWDMFAISVSLPTKNLDGNENGDLESGGYGKYIVKYVMCLQDFIGTCDMPSLQPPQTATIPLLQLGLTKNTSAYEGQPHYCHLKIDPDSIYADFYHSSTLKVPMPTGKPVIAIGAATTGHYLSHDTYNQSSLLTTLIPSLVNSITEEECDMFHFVLYIGYDSYDAIWDASPATFDLLKHSISQLIKPLKRCMEVDYMRIPYSNGWLTMIWSRMFVKSVRDGAGWFYQVNDDLRMEGRGWALNFTTTLDSTTDDSNANNELKKNEVEGGGGGGGGYGVIGPNDPKWNCTLLTQAMVPTRTHYSLFKTFYPLTMKDWYSDFWITEVYKGAGRMFCHKDFKAVNEQVKIDSSGGDDDDGNGGRGMKRRYSVCNRPKWTKDVRRDSLKLHDDIIQNEDE